MSTPSLELLHIPYSPWSEKARWALDARGVAYRKRVYKPLLGEPALRLTLRRFHGPVSVPVLLTPDGPIPDSLAIARYASTLGSGPELFPATSDQDVERWSALGEEGLSAGRGLSLARVVDDPAALGEMVPNGIRKVLGPLATGIARFGVRRTLRKYGAVGLDHETTLRAVLDAIRQVLAERDETRDERAETGDAPRTLLASGFTFADIAATQVLAFVTPPTTGLRIGRESRRAFTDPALAADYPDLLAWRDAIYAHHRALPPR